MAYSIRFKKRARQELDDCCHTYGASLRTELWQWLREIAASADSDTKIDSIDLVELLDEGLNQDVGQWNYAWQRWLQATPLEQIKAAVALLKKRCPPWQMRVAVGWFIVLGQFTCEVFAHYVVDHVNKTVTFILIDGLPGQS